MKLQTLEITVKPEALEWFDHDDAQPRVLQLYIRANGKQYNFVQQIHPEFFVSEFEQVMDAIKHHVKERVLAEL